MPSSFGDKGTFVDEIKFIQYLDENTALQEVRNGNLDLYYFRVSSDRLEDYNSRENLQVFEHLVSRLFGLPLTCLLFSSLLE